VPDGIDVGPIKIAFDRADPDRVYAGRHGAICKTPELAAISPAGPASPMSIGAALTAVGSGSIASGWAAGDGPQDRRLR
jgi:hypothetical protein